MFNRDYYLNKLIIKERNSLIKVITGIRRSGKSFLLNNIFYNHLVEEEMIDPKYIIKFAFDSKKDRIQLDDYNPKEKTVKIINGQERVNAKKFLAFMKEKTMSNGFYYLLLDEIQILEDFSQVLNSFIYDGNFDVYVTGSNSHLLSSEIETEFSGRGDRIHLLPLSFGEYLSGISLDKNDALNEYLRYGGIPLVQLQINDEEKVNQAKSILNETYIMDLKRKHSKADLRKLKETMKVIASITPSLINPSRIESTFKSVYKLSVMQDTISDYIDWMEEAYLLNIVDRYDVKGRKFIGSPYKIYFEDIGIRNAILSFRDLDESDLIESVVFNELRYRGYDVRIGVVKIRAKTDKLDKNNKPLYIEKNLEVDFVAEKNSKTYYIQVALEISNLEKKEQEYKSLRNIHDSFKKVIIVKNEGKYYYTNDGFLRISLLDFLINEDSLDW